MNLLLEEGRADEARDRAGFWVKRLEARRDPDLAPLISLLRDVAKRGKAALTAKLLELQPELTEIATALQQAPSVASLYTLDASADEAGPLQPKATLRKALQAWGQVSAGAVYSPYSPLQALTHEEWGEVGGVDDWLPAWREHPQLWNAFEVLDTIVTALRDEYRDDFSQTLALPLLDRAELLLREVLAANAAQLRRFEWGWLENRPALNLLGARIALDMDRPAGPVQLAKMEWLVLTLNPNDNQGFRDVLMRAYLENARIDDALSLAERYPEDVGNMNYNRVLALFAAGRRDDALSALRGAVQDAPKLLAWLLKAKPKPPKREQWGVRVGGDDEAWIYRCETLKLWQEIGAIDWLRTCAKELAPNRRRQPD